MYFFMLEKNKRECFESKFKEMLLEASGDEETFKSYWEKSIEEFTEEYLCEKISTIKDLLVNYFEEFEITNLIAENKKNI